MATIRDLFTFYLKAEHLRGQSVVVHIESCTVEQVYNPRIKRNEPRLLVRFHGKKLALCVNKTQASAIEQITRTDDYEKWVGHTIMLTPAHIERGDATITITAPPKPAEPPKATTSGQEAEEAGKEEDTQQDDFNDEEEYEDDLTDLKQA